jgi:pimeloyl-ACP methyl ester carboxylesterase
MRIVGSGGPVVVLLPGGAESAEGFAPALVEGLVADPGCRVVLWDRPRGGSLTRAPAAVHRMLADHDLGPAVLVGQSLGGAVAAMTACAHPGDVAGLVLLDPTPVNDNVAAIQIEGVANLMALRGSRELRRIVRSRQGRRRLRRVPPAEGPRDRGRRGPRRRRAYAPRPRPSRRRTGRAVVAVARSRARRPPLTPRPGPGRSAPRRTTTPLTRSARSGSACSRTPCGGRRTRVTVDA